MNKIASADAFSFETFVLLTTTTSSDMTLFYTMLKSGIVAQYPEIEFGINSQGYLYCALSGKLYTTTSIGQLVFNEWTYIAVTYSSGSLVLINNGKFSAPISSSSSSFSSFSTSSLAANYYVAIGARNASGTSDGTMTNGFLGITDEMRIWSEARTSTEILTYMTRDLRDVEMTILAYYEFDNGAGMIVYDLGPNHHNGQLAPSPYTPQWVISTLSISGVLIQYVEPPGPFPTEGFNITVYGKNFGSDPNMISVSLGQVNSNYIEFVDPGFSFNCSFPAGTGSQLLLTVQVENSQGLSSTSNTDIYLGYQPPYNYNITPALIPTSGSRITINGTNYGFEASLITVMLGQFQCSDVLIVVAHQIISCFVQGTGKNRLLTTDVNSQSSTQTWGPFLSFLR